MWQVRWSWNVRINAFARINRKQWATWSVSYTHLDVYKRQAQYKLIPSDVTAVLAEQNIESATGSFGENSDETYQYLSLIHI